MISYDDLNKLAIKYANDIEVIVKCLKHALKIWNQTKDTYDLIEDIQSVIDDYDMEDENNG